VFFLKVTGLQRGSKREGGRIKKETNGIKGAAEISVIKNNVTVVLAFTALNEHSWISKRFMLKI
jgi:hypothetical protein